MPLTSGAEGCAIEAVLLVTHPFASVTEQV